MEILFVRHGQTVANTDHRHQVPEEPLSVEGIKQVRAVVPEVVAWQPTHIISSPLARAQQSARIIATAAELPFTVHDEFRELRRPFRILGRKHYSLASVLYIIRWFFHAYVHHTDVQAGESYQSFRKRLERARSMLEQYPADARIVIVSHSIFINFFTFHACNMERLTFWQALPRFFQVVTHKNGRVTQLRYTERQPGVCSWQAVSEPTTPTT